MKIYKAHETIFKDQACIIKGDKVYHYIQKGNKQCKKCRHFTSTDKIIDKCLTFKKRIFFTEEHRCPRW